MNTLVAFLLMAFSPTADSAANSDAPASFQSSVYASSTHSLRVAVDKDQRHVVAVELLDEQGHVLCKQFVAKKISTYRARFDLNDLPNGHYQVVITDGAAIKTRSVDLTTQTPSARVQQTITIQ